MGLHTCTAVARSLCVSWAFLYLLVIRYRELEFTRPVLDRLHTLNFVNEVIPAFLRYDVKFAGCRLCRSKQRRKTTVKVVQIACELVAPVYNYCIHFVCGFSKIPVLILCRLTRFSRRNAYELVSQACNEKL